MLYIILLCINNLNMMTSASDVAVTSRSFIPFTAVKSVDDDYVCAIPPGLLSTFQTSSPLQCTSECQRSSPCGGFNTRENGLCELYGKNQATFRLQHGCRYFTEGLGEPPVVPQLGPSIAQTCPASQYATWNTALASLAVDGDPTSIACSYSTQNQSWWSIDLGSSRFIAGVQFVNISAAVPSSGIVIGCYGDGGPRDLSGAMFSSTAMTVAACLEFCKEYSYAGLQFSSECYCGNSYGSYGMSSGCTRTCSGDAGQICGGALANTVVFTGLCVVIGCYTDSLTRDLPQYQSNDDSLTLAKCSNYCYQKGYMFAGSQNSGQCSCGNSYGSQGTSNVCQSACSGDSLRACGGLWANTVMYTGYTSIETNSFNVWLSNTPPTVGQPLDKTTTTMCRASTTSVQMSANVFVKCYLTLPAYRYVIIESSAVGTMCLGEVMVYVA